MKFLITGGAGFIGSNLTKFLCDQKHEVVVIDDLSWGYRRLIDKRANFIFGKIQDRKLMEKALKGVDTVFHLAALSTINLSLKKPVAYFENNIMNALQLLEAMKKTGVKKIVFSSSSSVYGEPKKLPIREDDSKEPINPYGASKMGFENILSAYYHSFGINSVSLRYFNVYGPNDEQKNNPRAVPTWIKQAIMDEPLRVYWRGKQEKDFIFVEDIVQANWLAAKNCKGFHYYNVGSGKSIVMLDIIKILEKIFKKKLKINHAGNRAGDPQRVVADNSKIKKELGWRQTVSLINGLEKTVIAYQKLFKK